MKNKKGQRCALGHCGQWNDDANISAESLILDEMFRGYLGCLVFEVNDKTQQAILKGFNQNTPRGRVLAALQAIKAKQLAETKRQTE